MSTIILNNYEGLIKNNLIKSIKRCIELKGLKDNSIIEIEPDLFKHINKRGKETLYIGFTGFTKYNNWRENNKDKKHNYYKVNGFYIIELI